MEVQLNGYNKYREMETEIQKGDENDSNEETETTVLTKTTPICQRETTNYHRPRAQNE